MNDLFFNPFDIFGMQILKAPSKIVPKLKVRDDFEWVSDGVREEVNAYLLDIFGTRDESLVPLGTAYMFGRYALMRSETAVMLTNCIA